MPKLRKSLIPLDALVVGTSTIVPDATRPVAAIIDDDSTVSWAVWPTAPLPARAIGHVSLWPTSRGAWVIYETEDSEEADDVIQRSAVFVTPHGVTMTYDLGAGQLVGADSGGLWLGDPRDVSTWMEAPDCPEKPTDITDFEHLNPDDLEWVPAEPFWHSDFPNYGRCADDDFADISGAGNDQMDEVEPALPLPTPATELVRIHADGGRSVIRVDHLAHRVDFNGTQLTLQYYPTGPRQVLDHQGPGWIVLYEAREVTINVSNGLPGTIETEQLTSQPVITEDEDAYEYEYERQQAAITTWRDCFDLDGVDHTDWPLTSLPDVARTAAIGKLRAQFDDLEIPSIVWTRDHPTLRRAKSDYRNVKITDEGTWPATVIVVSFEHRTVPSLRLRRSYRVFNDSGHPRAWAHVTVQLDEDLNTGDIPSLSNAIDGVLDI